MKWLSTLCLSVCLFLYAVLPVHALAQGFEKDSEKAASPEKLTTAQKLAFSSSPSGSPEVANIKAFFAQYMAKYNHYLRTKEFKLEPDLYHENIMVMSSSVAPYMIDSMGFYKRTQSFLDNLQKQGVASVGWLDVNVRMLDKNLALASNTAGRFLKNGDEFNRVGVTYLLRKHNNEWRITSFAVHNAKALQS